MTTCTCGTPLPTETAAQRHARTCTRIGWPAGCHHDTDGQRCGKPIVRERLCAEHLGGGR